MGIRKTKAGLVYGKLPKGCKLCVEGKKLVLFVTGKCPFRCFYCPVSSERFGRDVSFANERPVKKISDVIEEARLMSAEGAGVTGGDPLADLKKTLSFIKALKQEFGKKFHIHLYTHLSGNKNVLEKLFEAGVDEIRFHFADPSKALEFSWDVGAEIPVIPGWEKTIKAYILRLEKLGVKFINLNQLEFSDSNWERLKAFGFKPEHEYSYVVKGSEELAKKILEWARDEGLGITVHYCPAEVKLRIQLVARFKRAARNIAKPFEIITKEGTILVGVLPLEKINEVRKLTKEFEVRENKVFTSPEIAEKLKGEVWEYYPTWDRKVINKYVYGH